MDLPIQKNNHIIKNSNLFRYMHIIKDRWRNEFFYNALNKHASNKVVLDMGTGTGILAFYALNAGAKFVYAIESDLQMAKFAEQVLLRKFDKSKFKVINADFWNDDLTKIINHPIDILVSETVGPGLFDQGMIDTWKKIKEFASSDMISIPDTLSTDLWIWNKNLKNKSSKFMKIIFNNELIDKDFFNSLVEVDNKFSDFFDYNEWMYDITSHSSPDNKIENILNLTLSNLSPIQTTLNFDTVSTIALIHKISFENTVLYLKDAQWMPWKNVPLFHISRSGKYFLKYEYVKKYPEPCWFIKRME